MDRVDEYDGRLVFRMWGGEDWQATQRRRGKVGAVKKNVLK